MFICSTTSNLNNFKPQQLQPQKRVQNERKNKTDVQNLENTLRIPTLPHFLKLFGLHQRVTPSFVSIFCNTMDVEKSQRVPPFTFFGTVTLFKNLIKKIFLGNFSCPQRVPLHFFHFLQPARVSQSPKGPPFSILSLRYGADFGRSRLVHFSHSSMELIIVVKLTAFSSSKITGITRSFSDNFIKIHFSKIVKLNYIDSYIVSLLNGFTS